MWRTPTSDLLLQSYSNYTYYKATVIKTVWYWHEDKYIDQWKIESAEKNPHIYNQMMFDKSAKTIQWGRVFSTNGARKTGYLRATE